MKTGSRRKSRECALQILYQIEALPELAPQAVTKIIDQFFDHFDAPGEVHPYTTALVHGIQANRDQIDATISTNMTKWRLERLNKVDRNVLRIATYELIVAKELAFPIVLDEAIEIARRFGTEKSAAFVNGVLDSIAANLGK